jgi:AcrR family transcriptional regulator
VGKRVSGQIQTSLRAAVATHSSLRARILAAALRLLESEGPDAVTTRAVAEAARVQPPILYRQFADKRGLLDALAEYGFTSYLSQKQLLAPAGDPVEALRVGWDLHVDFGLTTPAIYLLMYANPRPGKTSPAAEASMQMLRQHIHRVASVARLRVSEERAANLFHAAGSGTVLTLLGMSENDRDMTLSKMAREAAITAITTEKPAYHKVGSKEAAIALRATLNETVRLSESERALLVEWLDRISS